MKNTLIAASMLIAFAGTALAGTEKPAAPAKPAAKPDAKAETKATVEQKAEPVSAKAAFEDLKKLAGAWEGPAPAPEAPKLAVNYRVVSGGTTVMETLFPDSPHEMITMYTLDGDDLQLTHYCAAGNQPKMKLALKTSTAKALHFDFAGGSNLAPGAEHMHEGTIRLIDADHIENAWTNYQGDKMGGTHTFVLTRKK